MVLFTYSLGSLLVIHSTYLLQTYYIPSTAQGHTSCWKIWDLVKGMNPNGLASSFLPNNENVGNYTVVTYTVSSVDQRRAFTPWGWMTHRLGWQKAYALPWVRGICSNIIRVRVVGVHPWWTVRLSKCSFLLGTTSCFWRLRQHIKWRVHHLRFSRLFFICVQIRRNRDSWINDII